MKMHKTTLLLSAIIFQLIGNSQVINDSVILGPSYANQSYYQLESGEVKNFSNSQWDIAFDASGFGYSIRLNSSKGAILYKYPKGDFSSWKTVDTSGLYNWKALYDSDTSWSNSAFTSGEKGMNLGWGKYNIVTHQIHGDSLFVIKLTTGDYKKLFIEKLVGGTFSFKYADLDGKNEKIGAFKKSDFKNKNFGYYSLSTSNFVDQEPLNTLWDLVFTSYSSEVAPGMYYGVTGVLHNNGVEVAKAYPVASPEIYMDYASHSFTKEINTVGYNWKRFDRGSSKYILADSTCYFVKNNSGDIYRIVFTGFEGSRSGKINFSKEKVLTATSVVEFTDENQEIVVYPNPASEQISLVFTAFENSKLRILSLSGKVMADKEIQVGFQTQNINTDSYPSGIYFVNLLSGNQSTTKRLIIK